MKKAIILSMVLALACLTGNFAMPAGATETRVPAPLSAGLESLLAMVGDETILPWTPA